MTTPLSEILNKLDFENTDYTYKDIYKLTDLTLLDKNATKSQILTTFKNACQHEAAAICLYSEAFAYILDTNSIKKATVVNFPSGNMLTSQVISDIEYAINNYQIDEIDYVFAYREYLQGEKNKTLDACQNILEICQKYNKSLKVIIESGAFHSETAIYDLSIELAKQGCNFIKTSTGKIDKGATPDAVFAILNAIKDSGRACGIKVSGGVRTFEIANMYKKLAEYVLDKKTNSEWFRIGASRLL